MTSPTNPPGGHVMNVGEELIRLLAVAWQNGYGEGRDDEGDGLPMRSNPYRWPNPKSGAPS